MTSLTALHDATLQTVNFGWETGVVRLTFEVGVASSDLAIVEAEGVTSLKCPRLYPWGSSSSVNAAAVEESVDGKLLTIEMQSGDVLEVRCREVAVNGRYNSQHK
jgi:hypothetical protein